MKDEDLEEGVHEEDPIRLNGGGVEQNRLRRSAEGVRVEDRLDHDQALRQVFTKQAGSEGWKQIVLSSF